MAETVVLLHGIFRTSHSMRGLENFLNTQGFNVLNLDYPSTKHQIEELVEFIHQKIQPGEKIHFVGFSMGGLLIRAYITKYRPQNLGRVVMIGSPNNGSEIADFFQNWYLFRKLWGPAGQQLITNQKDFKHIFGQVDYELGIIAGNRSAGRIFSMLMIRKPSDGTVSVESTKLEGMKEHQIIKSTHTFFPGNRRAWNLTARFLKNGSFTQR